MANDLTVEILKQIRDGIGTTNERISTMNQDFNERLDQTNTRLGRVEQGLLDLGEFMRQIALDQAKHERFHMQHVDVLEKNVQELKVKDSELQGRLESQEHRISELEKQVGK